MSFEPIHGVDVPTSNLPFSPAVRAGEFVFVSGQASVDDQGRIVSDSFENEVRRSFENLSRTLSAAGLALKDVVKVAAFVRDPDDLPAYNRLYREFFQAPYPARTTLTHCLPETLKFEIDVIAHERKPFPSRGKGS